MKKLLLILLMSTAVFALEPEKRTPLPDPNLALEPDTFSLMVIQADADDPGVSAFTDSLWSQLTGQGAKLPESLSGFASFITQNRARDALLKALPVQVVRTDQLDKDGELQSTNMLTLSGWKGLQGQFFKKLLKDEAGKAYPSILYRRADIYARSSGQLTRLNGTFFYVTTLERMKLLVERVLDKKPGKSVAWRPKAGAEVIGVAINQHNAFTTVLKRFDGEQLKQLRAKLGGQRLDQGIAKIQEVHYTLDLLDENEALCQFRVTTAPRAAAEVESLIRDLPAAFNLPELPAVEVRNIGADSFEGQFKISGIKDRIRSQLNIP